MAAAAAAHIRAEVQAAAQAHARPQHAQRGRPRAPRAPEEDLERREHGEEGRAEHEAHVGTHQPEGEEHEPRVGVDARELPCC